MPYLSRVVRVRQLSAANACGAPRRTALLPNGDVRIDLTPNNSPGRPRPIPSCHPCPWVLEDHCRRPSTARNGDRRQQLRPRFKAAITVRTDSRRAVGMDAHGRPSRGSSTQPATRIRISSTLRSPFNQQQTRSRMRRNAPIHGWLDGVSGATSRRHQVHSRTSGLDHAVQTRCLTGWLEVDVV
jgi:hypothetical protein